MSHNELKYMICTENTEIHSYYKATESHQYLDFFHAIQDMLNRIIIPIALARKICTKHRLGELETFLSNQNHQKKLIYNGIEKAKK